MSVATKRILAAAVPVLLAALAFVVGDRIVVHKYLGTVQEELEQSTRSLRGALLNVRAETQRRTHSAANDLSASPTLSADDVAGALRERGLHDVRGWVITTRDGVVITESGETLEGVLGTRGDLLFDVSRELGGGADFAVLPDAIYLKSYAPFEGGERFLGVLLPAEPVVESAADGFFGDTIGAAFYAPNSVLVGDASISVGALHDASRFFDRITAAKATGFRVMGSGDQRSFVAAAPVFDFEQWDIHGFALVSHPRDVTMRAIRGSRVIFWVIALVSVVIAVLGMRTVLRIVEAAPPRVFQSVEQRRRIRNQMVLLGAIVVLPAALGVAWAMVRSNADTAEVMAVPISSAAEVATDLAARLSNDDEDALVSAMTTMKQTTDADYTLVRTDGSRVSTFREERAGFDVTQMDVWTHGAGVRIGIIRINYVVHRIAAITVPDLGGDFYVTVEDTPYQNLVASDNAKLLTIIIVLALLVTVAVWIVGSVHRERTFRLALAGFLFITPALIILLWWAIGPLLFSLFLTFHRWSIINPAKPFVGFANYVRMFGDHQWWQSLVNTGYYTLHIPLAMAVSLAVAMAMSREMRGITVFRTIFYLPTVNSLVVTALMWRLIFNPEFGLLNYLLDLVGIPPLSWLSHPTTAMPSIMLVTIWFSIGGQMILFLAGLKSIPKTYYEVADIDGSSGLAKFWYITLPLLRPTLLFVLITSTIGSFQVFTQVYMLTQGGPAGSTDVAMYRIYTEAWYNLRMGYGATQAWTLSLIIFIFTAFQFRFFSREIKYS